jgi:pilus assembly protein CpaE
VLLLHLGTTWREELESLMRLPADQRPALLLLGPANDAAVMRLAMQAGARDFLNLPFVEQEMVDALARVARDRRPDDAAGHATMTAFVNAKGGCGASLLACNVAHLMAQVAEQRTTLIDFDLQFGTLPLYLDLYPKRSVLEAIENLDELDELALDGYMARHVSGLRVLGHTSEDTLPPHDPTPRQIERLLELAGAGQQHLVADLPRRIDDVATAVIERARHVVVVTQQSLTTLRDAGRLMQILRRDLGVPRERIVVVVNRYEKHAAVTIADIQKTLNVDDVALVPNDFRVVSECVNSGVPLYEAARSSAIVKALRLLEARVGGRTEEARPGLLARTFSGILKPRSSWQVN